MLYEVTVTIVSGNPATTTSKPVDMRWYRGDSLPQAMAAMAQAAVQDVTDTYMPESVRTHLLSVRLDFTEEN